MLAHTSLTSPGERKWGVPAGGDRGLRAAWAACEGRSAGWSGKPSAAGLCRRDVWGDGLPVRARAPRSASTHAAGTRDKSHCVGV